MPAPRSGQNRFPTYSAKLNAVAAPRPVNNALGIGRYYRSLDLVLRQADEYRAKGNEEQLYVLLMRYASLVLETLPKHHEFDKSNRRYVEFKRLLLSLYMPELERLKVSIDTRHAAADKLQEAPWQPRHISNTVALSSSTLSQLHWPDGASGGATPPASGPLPPAPPAASSPSTDPSAADLAALSALSVSPGLALRPASKQALLRHSVLPSPSATAPSPPATVSGLGSTGAFASTAAGSGAASAAGALYPIFDPSLPAMETAAPSAPPPGQPSMPPPQLGQASQMVQVVVPPASGPNDGVAELLSMSLAMQQGPPPALALGPQELPVATVAQPTAPLPPDASCCTAPPAALAPTNGGVRPLEKRRALRDVHISKSVMDDFLRYALYNTRRGIESCGILAGTLSANDSLFNVTTLIIPKQEGTSDTVQALGEEEIFEVQDSRALYPLGWIHTHPSQTCFLSSVDVHTHCGYQTMLDEAIAIVMAPRDPSKQCGIFRLTTPGGLKLVQACTQRGFHSHRPTHTGQPLYELCGHVFLNERLQHDVVDLR